MNIYNNCTHSISRNMHLLLLTLHLISPEAECSETLDTSAHYLSKRYHMKFRIFMRLVNVPRLLDSLDLLFLTSRLLHSRRVRSMKIRGSFLACHREGVTRVVSTTTESHRRRKSYLGKFSPYREWDHDAHWPHKPILFHFTAILAVCQ